MTPPDQTTATKAALITLIILQTIMLLALFTRTEPHPPLTIPLFAMAPFLSAALSAATVALLLNADQKPSGQLFCLLAVVMALVSFGPQKYLDPAFPVIWPAVIGAQIASLTICWQFIKTRILNTKEGPAYAD